MPKEIKKLKLEKEMYDEALSEGMSFSEFLKTLEQQDGCVPSKNSGVASLDAFERQLMAHNIVMDGEDVSLAEEFYKTKESSVLFPEFINRNVVIGMEATRNECTLADIVASEGTIDSDAYSGIDATLASSSKGAHRVGEGGKFPVIKLTTADKTIKLKKIGHEIDFSYEVLRRMRVDLLAVHMQMVGVRLRRNLVAAAIDVLINGDGNSNSAPVTSATGLTYDGLVDFDQEFTDFTPTTLIATKAGIKTLLKMSEFKDPMAGFNYQKTGDLISPLGLNLKREDNTVAADSLIGVDKNFALEKLNEKSASLVETDRIIGKQIAETLISEVVGFKKVYTNASRVWDYS